MYLLYINIKWTEFKSNIN